MSPVACPKLLLMRLKVIYIQQDDLPSDALPVNVPPAEFHALVFLPNSDG